MSKKHSYKFIKEQIEKEGYNLLSKEYINTDSKLNLQCLKKHEYRVTYNNFKQGRRCPICWNKKHRKLDYDFIKEQIEKEGYKLLSKNYKNSSTKLKVQCSKGHIYKVKYNSFQQKCRCPICDYEKIISKVEKEIFNIVCFLTNNKVIANDRTQIINPLTNHNLELDIWIPELNKAIEFNGEYWHNFKYQIIKDKIKVEQCKEKNIDLLVIQEQNWMNDKEKETKKINLFLKGK